MKREVACSLEGRLGQHRLTSRERGEGSGPDNQKTELVCASFSASHLLARDAEARSHSLCGGRGTGDGDVSFLIVCQAMFPKSRQHLLFVQVLSKPSCATAAYTLGPLTGTNRRAIFNQVNECSSPLASCHKITGMREAVCIT